MSTAQTTKNCITLRGSAQIIVEYLKYGINSILFQRGIYPPETFENTQQYGITILMSKDKKIEDFLANVLQQTEEWLAKNMIEKISMIITNAHTKEVLECWDFKMQAELGDGDTSNSTKLTSSKELKRIQNEIRDVMRQISATVSYLPLLDCICTFDVMLYTLQNCEIPEKWDETGAVFIQNAQAVQLRSFSTGLHKVDTVVNYKMSS
ncbi:PREDICTED: mitotic spindle assembly checkpoint protein MAD2A [Rhagoletis zephyria]|uniref:mitotic spindle assembly checkpoint protein MAD2A n=1 Tax=Rhagoletis zephyria TaxID=28612 RepID=UPI0008113376|nr:PREDICTED: mitotic spindle assembly checkpoint protein MAD2A [Rhagoletis zephyria]XP_036335467.1 mitotic spindle assembly checkpoint protein MAD2A-like [Rhagoletis pomonella]XP_036335488.1 mitotic spindle assembly checkpoint protein MAD2A-like [Rhagoletis pomonella]